VKNLIKCFQISCVFFLIGVGMAHGMETDCCARISKGGTQENIDEKSAASDISTAYDSDSKKSKTNKWLTAQAVNDINKKLSEVNEEQEKLNENIKKIDEYKKIIENLKKENAFLKDIIAYEQFSCGMRCVLTKV
jgi:hypothetical protein